MDKVVAVSTTGIYCRPGCASSAPRSDHVTSYPSAAAAEAAGFRACLRCRPYRTSWVNVDGAPEVVCRAVRLILEGALNEGTEDCVGRAVGMSARHLRRVFMDHLGVTPTGLAVSVRAHFARRLLDDTDLTFTEVAFAAGFGSVRQFNKVMADVFRKSPRELRSRRHKRDRLVADGGFLLRLPVHEGFDWPGSLVLLGDAAAPGVEAVSDSSYRRIVLVEDDVAVIEVLPPEDAEHLLVKLHLPHCPALLNVVQRVRHMLGFDTSLTSARRHLEDDPVLGPLMAKRPGLRPIGEWSSYEAAVKAILGAPVDPAAARRLSALVGAADTAVGGLSDLRLTNRFPSPAAVSDADGCRLPFDSGTVHALVSLASAVDEGSLAIDADQPMGERVRALRSLDGIGAATAERFALLIGDGDAFCPSGRVQRALERSLGRRVDAAELRQCRERWRPYGPFAFAHLTADRD
jgi:AraC family transcriptional regulator, regulatory protein of adaptative response / DNA-3-methyladenine glycosylase II